MFRYISVYHLQGAQNARFKTSDKLLFTKGVQSVVAYLGVNRFILQFLLN